MNTNDDNTDTRFRELFERTGLESPSENFTAGIMERIAAPAAQDQGAGESNPVRRWIGGIGIGLLGILGLSVAYYFGVRIMPEWFKPLLSPVFDKLLVSFKGMFDTFEVSGTTIAIILGFAFLVLVERLLGRSGIMKNTYFSF